MLFNSIEFAIFLPVVFILYWFVTSKALKLQNLLIVAASYLFYGWWDWRFLSLIIFSTILDFSIGILLSSQQNELKRKVLLWTSIIINLGLLGVFKYYNWFLDSLYNVIPGLQVIAGFNSLDILLPVGISFYTFQTLSYTIDVYKKSMEPTKDLVEFAAFVSFFPQLVAGPIERANHLLPQFQIRKSFNYAYAVDGLRQILWGLFMKVVIADNCAGFANQIFNNSDNLSGSTLVLGAIFFTFQIYGDFAGYSNIAIGTSKLFGFDLMQNFNYPYFSRDIAEFWRRWHISLSTWFRDYLYIPLGGSRGSKWEKVRNIFIIFIVSGFWHGANWTFIVWGALNALYFLPLLLTNANRTHVGEIAKGKTLPSAKEFLLILFTFGLTVFAWIFFRAENLNHAITYIGKILSMSLFEIPRFNDMRNALILILIVAIFLIIEWNGRGERYSISNLGLKWKKPTRYFFYYCIIGAIFWFGGKEQQFIYFQF
ncbi:MBOAT family O-acyltransferase [Algoriphagus boritolerans]|uniref:D-alanyl-lipoteichoic acid acyltransferase DltB, MBOAT superfamily n=1 Tax=Algoriphagus boritolerans DSM 17298 = JCM 18970 TaxID=1120964 RepID=A0A1H5SC48_9BACT|nr:MBOAT family O-acyltransferase [Algoriphagus boritolerans]SEF47984.1 D-alanyl-lipoteichoic acid acyltransferase DltB, MBOAT superfamily [Algoriphagus boritolerans DSM 17298 = JCM 18970]